MSTYITPREVVAIVIAALTEPAGPEAAAAQDGPTSRRS
jgi:hypothetical protein